MHMECMSIVTDATQNQNGADLTLNWGVENYNFGKIPLTGRTAEIVVDLTLSWGVEIIVDLTLIGESNLS